MAPAIRPATRGASPSTHISARRLLGIALAAAVLAKAAPALAQEHPPQHYMGTLFDEAGQALVGATVLALPGLEGTTADAGGAWHLNAVDADSLQFDYVGYARQTIATADLPPAGQIVLGGSAELEEIVVAVRQGGTFTSTLDPRHVETITSHELKKAPCCNLGESFETNAAVDVSYRDAATGAREMQVLGLRGIYSQLLIEKRPTLYGLAAPIALDLIPGTWLESIQIGKGAASVQTGANALAGQVNTELEKPTAGDPLFVNLFASAFGRVEANVHAAETWNDRHATSALTHASHNPRAIDRDEDGFYEQGGRQTYTGLVRHFVTGERWAGQGNVWLASDRRDGGQTDHRAGTIEGHSHTGDPYRITQANDRVEAFAKTAYLGFARPLTSVGIIGGATSHRLDNAYGPIAHAATQRSGYLSALFSSYLGNTAHTYTVGATHQVDAYDETLDARVYDRRERATGAFAEYTYDRPGVHVGDRHQLGLSVIAGLRVDRHSLGGWQALPRVNVKLDPTERLVVRASAGRAYRSAQVIAENLRLLPSSRTFVIDEPLRLETGWNYGVALTHELGTVAPEMAPFRVNGQVGLDLYATRFDNVAVVDQETTLGFTRVGNAVAPAVTQSALASLQVEVARGLELKLAYKRVDSRQTYRDGVERVVPYIARWRGLFAGEYELPSRRWRFNANVQVVGPQRLPGQTAFETLPIETSAPLVFMSPTFALATAQATYVFTDLFEVYVGVENIGGYRQERAILGVEDPSSGYFDASRVYAPLTGQMPYVGLRFHRE